MLTLPAPSCPAPTHSRQPAQSLLAVLMDLYRQQLDAKPEMGYLREHARPTYVAGHVRSFLWYERYLPEGGKILDWGCCHAPDSCLLRAHHGQRFDLYGCDFSHPGQYPVFHDFAGIKYTRLTDLVQLPYPDASFDVVIGSGTLEHVAMDYESLKQLHRILRPGGTLIVTYLPNRWSSMEWWRRVSRKTFHRRLYGLAEAQRLLLHVGFYPHAAGYHFHAWERALSAVGLRRIAEPGAAVLNWLCPVDVFSSTLHLVAERRQSM
jgi:SAM-dependent methyltransferase